jgi:hypothetical protein
MARSDAHKHQHDKEQDSHTASLFLGKPLPLRATLGSFEETWSVEYDGAPRGEAEEEREPAKRHEILQKPVAVGER